MVGRWLLCLTTALAACDAPPPIKSSSGERIEGVSIEERFSLDPEVKERVLHGDRLRAAAEAMDRHGVLRLSGTYTAKTLRSSTVTIIVKPAGGAERRVTMESCAQPNMCAFFDEAVKKGILEHLPTPCRSGVACDKR